MIIDNLLVLGWLYTPSPPKKPQNIWGKALCENDF